MTQLVLFDYDQLDTTTRNFVQQRTEEIRILGKRMTGDIIGIGQRLAEIKYRLGHGNFGAWLEYEFDWTDRMAQNFMRVAVSFKSENFSDLEIQASALYLLSAPSTPKEARDEAIARAENGEKITHKKAKEIVSEHKDEPETEPPELEQGAVPAYLCSDCGELFYWAVWHCPYCHAHWNEGVDRCRACDHTEPTMGQRRDLKMLEQKAPELFEQVRRGKISVPQAKEIMSPKKPHVSQSAGNNEWYTPPKFIEAARAVMGGIDCDPASSEIANRTVKAETFYTKEIDGLLQTWAGRVWMNPPYSQPLVRQFCEAMINKLQLGEIQEACVLVNNATETGWFHTLLSEADCLCLLKGRVKFLDVEGNPSGAPLQGQIVLYYGDNINEFVHLFGEFGMVLHVAS